MHITKVYIILIVVKFLSELVTNWPGLGFVSTLPNQLVGAAVIMGEFDEGA